MIKAAIVTAFCVMGAGHAFADQVLWPSLAPGEIKHFSGEPVKSWRLVLEAAGLSPGGDIGALRLSFFKAPHGRDLVVVDPCCFGIGTGASLYALENGGVQPVALTVGDPREGFLAQPHADSMMIEPGATALRARIAFADCERGVWNYYYQFDDADRPVLLSVIDTGCGHLGVRELYHSKQADLGHWWQR